MKIAYIDLTGIAYDPLTPERLPLGGMQSAVCYLSREFTRQGHAVSLFNGSETDTVVEGIAVHGFARCFATLQLDHDVFISISCSGRSIRPLIGDRPLILCTGHNTNEPSMQVLSDAQERDCWDRYVFKSSWQAETMQRKFSLDETRIRIISNGVSPAFAQLGERRSFFFLENRPPVLYYSSTPFRGLEVLAKAFPAIAAACPGISAKIYSSMAPYHSLGQDGTYASLYDLCRRAGMDYVGSLSQPALAKAVQEADMLAFPSTYAETSCMTVMEAMANSALIVSRALGAIPETTAGFASLLTGPPGGTPTPLPRRFAAQVVNAVTAARRAPQRTALRLQMQRRYCLTNYSWVGKAHEWESLLQEAVARRSRNRSASAPPRHAGPVVYHYVQTLSGAKLYVNPHDWRARRMLHHGGSFNRPTQALWRAALGMAQWTLIADVGANYGEMLFEPGVKTCPRVLAFEPNPQVLPYLARTLADSPNIRIVPAALSDHTGEASFAIDAKWSGRSHLGDGPNQTKVRVMTLDSLLTDGPVHPDGPLRLLMKLDVEGHEIDVLRGAARSIARAAEFCCLIEVSHLAAADAAWLQDNFSIHALSQQQQRIVTIDRLAALAEHKHFWQEDVLLRRKVQEQP